MRKAIAAGLADEAVVDRAAARVLTRKCELGMLDPGWTALPCPGDAVPLDLDPPEHRKLAGRLAEESVVLLANPRGVLPLRAGSQVAVVGPDCVTTVPYRSYCDPAIDRSRVAKTALDLLRRRLIRA